MTLFVKLAADDRCLVSFVTNRGHKWLVVVAYYVFDSLASLFVLVQSNAVCITALPSSNEDIVALPLMWREFMTTGSGGSPVVTTIPALGGPSANFGPATVNTCCRTGPGSNQTKGPPVPSAIQPPTRLPTCSSAPQTPLTSPSLPFGQTRWKPPVSLTWPGYTPQCRAPARGNYNNNNHSSTSIFVPSAAETSVCSTLTAPFIRMMSKAFSVASLVLLSPSRSGWTDPFRFWSSQGGHLMAEIGVGVHPGVAFLSVCSFRSSCLCKISDVFCLLVPNS